MKCQDAVLRGIGADWEVQEITLDPPRGDEDLTAMTQYRRGGHQRRAGRPRGRCEIDHRGGSG